MFLSRRLLRVLAPVFVAAVTVSGCSSADSESSADSGKNGSSLSVTHAQGKTDVPVNPKNVLVFDMASLDTLDALGVDSVTGVPQESLPSYLEKYAGEQYTNIGTLKEPDYEVLPSLKPDLIIVAGRSAATYPELAKNFTVIDMSVDPTNFYEDFTDNVEKLAKIFDKESEAKALIDGYEDRIAKVKQNAGDAGKGLIVLTSGGEVTAYGTGSRFDMIHSLFGVTPAIDDIKHEAQHGEAITFEYIKEANPDWLFVVDRDAVVGNDSGAAAKEVLDNELVAGTTAWSENQVAYLNPEAWYIVSGGITSVSTIISDMEKSVGGK